MKNKLDFSGEFESNVNSDSIQTFWLTKVRQYRFESNVNSDSIQTQLFA